jgi:hypothetical protein
MTGNRRTRPLSQVEIEDSIVTIADALEVGTEQFADVADLAATCEADYKLSYARAFVALASTQSKMTAPERQARSELHAAAELRAWKVAEARRMSSKESLLSLRARLDALRTVSANIRSQT